MSTELRNPQRDRNESRERLEVLRQILLEGSASTQDEIATQLKNRGFEVNQSTISRALRKLGAIKTINESGEVNYLLKDDASLPPPKQATVADLVLSIETNGTIIVLHTSIGSASLVARHLDHYRPGGILGTIAGDDTIFVAPPSQLPIQTVIETIRKSLSSEN